MNIRRIKSSISVFVSLAAANALLAVGAMASTDSVTVEWDPVDDARVSFYEVYWGQQSDRQYPSSQSQEVTTNRATIGNLTAGETYYFSAKACDSANQRCSEFSEEVSATIASGENSVTVEWDPVVDPRVSSYRVFWINRSDRQYESSKTSTSTSATIDNLAPDQTYYFAVKACNETGEICSEFSEERSATVASAPRVFGQSTESATDDGVAEASATDSTLQNDVVVRSAPADAESFEPTVAPDYEIAVGLGANSGDGGWIFIYDSAGNEVYRYQLDWPEYNSLSGEARLAAGDIDGDGKQEIVIGFGPVVEAPDMPWGDFQLLDDDFSLLAWGRVEWPEYNDLNGETRPAVGDFDGDGVAEIAIGLGSGGGGLVQIFQYTDGELVSAGWTQVDWPDYAESNGETRVASGDVDGDNADELVIGFGANDGTGIAASGNFLIKDEIVGLSASTAITAGDPEPLLSSWDSFGTLTWADYADDSGETYPATGDIDNDGIAEVVLGLGQGGNGTIEVFDFEPGGYVLPVTTASLPWPEYNSLSGEIRPAVADLNGDGFAEVIAGLSQGGAGRVEVFENFSTQLWHQYSIIAGDAAYNTANGETWPAVIQLPAVTALP